MSLLRDFGGALLTNVGADMQQRENDQRLTALQESIEKRRYAREMERKARDEPQRPVAEGPVVDRGNGQFVQPTTQFKPARYNEDTAERVSDAAWVPGPDQQATDPDALTRYQREQLQLRRDTAEATDARYRDRTAKSGSGGGSGSGSRGKPSPLYLPNGMMQQRELDASGNVVNVGDPVARWESSNGSGSDGAGSDKTGSAARKELVDAVKLLSKAKTIDEIAGAARIAGISIPAKAELTPPTPGRLYGTNEASDEDYKAALKAHVGSQLDERLAPKKAEANAPAVPAGANEGAIYGDDKTGQKWKVQGGKMVPI